MSKLEQVERIDPSLAMPERNILTQTTEVVKGLSIETEVVGDPDIRVGILAGKKYMELWSKSIKDRSDYTPWQGL